MIAAHNANQRHAVNVVPFRDHLPHTSKLNFARVQPINELSEILAPAYGVPIHAPDARAWKNLLQPLLALLRSRAEVVEMLARAFGTMRGNRALVPAIVALQPLPFTRLTRIFGGRLVVRQERSAILALELFSARPADPPRTNLTRRFSKISACSCDPERQQLTQPATGKSWSCPVCLNSAHVNRTSLQAAGDS